MPRRSVSGGLILSLFGLSCGCATDGMSDAFHQMTRAVTPHSSDSKDAADDTGDEWNEVGRQMRADRPVEQENDPLRNLFVSPRAQEIERSLGVD